MINAQHRRAKNKMPLWGLEIVVLKNNITGDWQRGKCADCGLEGIFFKSKGNPHCSVCYSSNIQGN